MSTSPQRTYRYLRLGIAGMVLVIFASIGVAAASVGWLSSISDYFYSPARTAFSGALLSVSLALLALSGRGVDRALLDAAALFAPLIALIPTTLGPGTIAGIDVPCEFRCFPPAFEADVAKGIATYLIVGVVAIGVALALAARGQVPWSAVAVSGSLAVGVLAALALTWLFAPDAVLAQGHYVATLVFFALFAAVALRTASVSGPGRYRGVYIAIALLLIAVLVAYIAFLPQSTEFPVVLLAEAAALVLFAAFWVVQSIDKWNDADPSVR